MVVRQAADLFLCICVLLSIILVCGMKNCFLWKLTACVREVFSGVQMDLVGLHAPKVLKK